MAIRRFAVDLASCSCTAPAKGLAIVASAIFHTSLDRNSMIDHFVPKSWFSKGMLRSIWFFLNRALCVFQCNFPFFITFTSLKEPKTSSFDKQQREFLKSLPAVTVLEMLLPYVHKQVEAHQLVAQWPTKHHISWFVWVRTWKLSQMWWTFLARNETYRCNMWIYTVICPDHFRPGEKYCSKGFERLFHVTYLRQLIYHKNNFTRKVGGSFWSTRSTPRNAPKTSGFVSQFKSLSGDISP